MKTDELIEFGKRIREIRKQLHLSQIDFANAIGISNTFLSEVEKGKFKPGYDFFINTIKKFNINTRYLATGEGDIFFKNINETKNETKINFGEYSEIIEEMLMYFEQAPVVKFAVLEFYKNYIYDKGHMIKKEVERYKKQKLKKENKDKDNK
jgi:transcriptional regulator with XRE-family HTH domain